MKTQDGDHCSECEIIIWRGWVQEGGRKSVTALRREAAWAPHMVQCPPCMRADVPLCRRGCVVGCVGLMPGLQVGPGFVGIRPSWLGRQTQ